MPRVRLIVLLQSFAIAIAVSVGGCLSASVETSSLAGIDLSGARRVHVLPPKDGGSDDEDALDSALVESLELLARDTLVSRGFELGGLGDSELRIALDLRVENVVRTTWSSDPDASSIVNVEVEEAVVLVRALDRAGTRETWRAESRSRLPEREIVFAPSRAQIWRHTLVEALDAFPFAPVKRTDAGILD